MAASPARSWPASPCPAATGAAARPPWHPPRADHPGRRRRRQGRPQLLDRISLAAADVSGPTPHAGQFVYIASKVASTHPRTIDDKTTVVSRSPHSRQFWNSLDGKDGWLIEAGETSGEGTTPASDTPVGSAYDALVKLPTDPAALLQRIHRDSDAVRDHEVPRDQAAFVAIGDLLTES